MELPSSSAVRHRKHTSRGVRHDDISLGAQHAERHGTSFATRAVDYAAAPRCRPGDGWPKCLHQWCGWHGQEHVAACHRLSIAATHGVWKVAVTSPTGVGAHNIDGCTLARWGGYGVIKDVADVDSAKLLLPMVVVVVTSNGAGH
jgi:hypothetical protein